MDTAKEASRGAPLPSPATPPPHRPRRGRRLRVLVACLLLVPVLCVLALGALVGTGSGSRWLLARALVATGDTVELQGVEGNLISELKISSLVVRDVPGLLLRELRLAWRPSSLLQGELRIVALEIGSIALPPATPTEADSAPLALPDPRALLPQLPLALRVERFALGRVETPAQADDAGTGPDAGRGAVSARRVLLDSLRFAARLDAAGLHIDGLALQAGGHRVKGVIGLRGPEAGLPRLEAALDWQGPHGLQPVGDAAAAAVTPDGVARLAVQGALDDLGLQLEIRAPATARIDGRIRAPGLVCPVGGCPNGTGPDLPEVLASLDLGLQGALEDAGPFAAQLPLAVVAWPTFRLDGSLAHGLELGVALTAGPADGLHPYATQATVRLPPAPAGVLPEPGRLALDLDWQATATSAPEAAGEAGVPWPRRLAGSGRLAEVDGAWQLEHRLEAPQAVTLTAQYEAAEGSGQDQLAARADLEISDQQLPARWQGEPLTLDRFTGRLSADGPLDALRVGLVGDGALAPVGPVALALDAAVSPAEVALTAFSLSALSGKVDAAGRIGLPSAQAAAQVDLSFEAAGLDFEALFPGVPSRLGASGRASLALAPEGPQGELHLERLAGRWRDAPLEARGQVLLAAGRHEIQGLQASLGGNRVTGELAMEGGRLAGQLDLDLPTLSLAHPDLAGAVAGELAVGGTPAAPTARGQLTARGLRFDGRGAERIDATVDLDPAAVSRIAVTAEGIAAGEGLPVERLAAVATGNAAAHRLDLTVTGPETELSVDVSGGWQAPQWQGVATRVAFTWPQAGSWRSPDPSRWTWDGNTLRGDALCLVSEEAEACLREPRFDATGAGSGQASLTRFDLARLHPLLPAGVPPVQGLLDLAADLRLRPGALPDVDFRLDGTEVRVPLGGLAGPRSAEGAASAAETELPDVLALSRLEASGALAGGGLRLDALVTGDEGLDLKVEGLTLPIDGGDTLSGHVTLVLGEVDGVMSLVPAVGEASGRFTLDARLAGSVEAPRVDARFALAEGGLTLPSAGLRLTVLQGTVASPVPGVAELKARVGHAESTLALSGKADLRGDTPWWQAEVSGKDFPLVRRPELAFDVSPDLRLAGSGDALDLTGSIAVPSLLLAPFLPPASAVAPSEDTVYVDAPEAGTEPADAPLPPFLQRLAMDVHLLLGEAVRVSGWGLDTRVQGDLRVRKQRGPAAPRGQGELELVDGRFDAYGQKLTVEEGRILFAGPVDDPRLAVRAIRPGIAVKAGVRVTGPVQSPDIRLFSEPTQSDADTLAYIVTGKPLASATAGEGDALRAAALKMGAEKAALVTGPIANAFGLDSLDVATGSSVDETNIQLGKALSPRLSLRSGFNPFDQLWSFILAYRLSERWAVEAQTGGASSAADLIYSIETDDLGEVREFWR